MACLQRLSNIPIALRFKISSKCHLNDVETFSSAFSSLFFFTFGYEIWMCPELAVPVSPSQNRFTFSCLLPHDSNSISTENLIGSTLIWTPKMCIKHFAVGIITADAARAQSCPWCSSGRDRGLVSFADRTRRFIWWWFRIDYVIHERGNGHQSIVPATLMRSVRRLYHQCMLHMNIEYALTLTHPLRSTLPHSFHDDCVYKILFHR